VDFVRNLVLFATVKEFRKLSTIDKVIAMVRVAPFFNSRCIWLKLTHTAVATADLLVCWHISI